MVTDATIVHARCLPNPDGTGNTIEAQTCDETTKNQFGA